MGTIVPNMGTPTRRRHPPPKTSLGDALFAGTRQKLLAALFGDTARSFYARELIGLAGSGSGAVQRELERLTASGLVTANAVGNQKHFRANAESPVFDELCAITRKTFGLADPLRKALQPLAARIRAAFVYGSVAKREDTAASDIDLLVIADKLSYGDLIEALMSSATALDRRVNPTVLTTREWTKRLGAKSSIVTRVMAQPKIWVIGSDDELSA